MRNLCNCVLVLLAFVVLSLPASAQRGGMFHTPDMQGVWNPVVGSGGTYEITKTSGDKTQMDIFIVGKDSVGGKDGYWLEMVMQDQKRGGQFVIKTLSAFDGGSLEMTKVIMQLPGQNPMEMPVQMSGQGKRNIDIKSNGTVVGTETVTTPAGTFTAEHWRSNDGGDVWVSSDVPPYGLVKSTNKDGTSMTLVHKITDAKDRITGTPQPFNPMNMAPQH